ncbi:MAG TPA: hypothetical protein ENI23_16730 [bacterium]|nr:hypothetical protein [bacterium]
MKIKDWSKIKAGTLLLITWDDIVSDASWLKDCSAQIYQPARCKDIGWFVNEDKLNIRITTSVQSSGEKNISVIPKGVIRNVIKIKYKVK